MADNIQDFPGMLRAALGDRVAADADTFIDMLAVNAVMEFPFAPPGLPTRLEGADAVASHLAKLACLIAFDAIGPATTVASGEHISVLMFTASGRGVATGAAYEQRYLSVIETRDGRIVRYLDYWDPLAVTRALLGDDAMKSVDLGEVYDV